MIQTIYDPRRDTLDVYFDDLAIAKLEQATDEGMSYAVGKTREGLVVFLTIFDASRLTYAAWRASRARAALPESLSADIDAWCARPSMRAGLDTVIA